MRLALKKVDEAYGGEETILRYGMQPLVGIKEDFFGIYRVLFPGMDYIQNPFHILT